MGRGIQWRISQSLPNGERRLELGLWAFLGKLLNEMGARRAAVVSREI